MISETYALIARYHPPGGPSHDVFMTHAKAVSKKALAVAGRFAGMDLDFIEEAALLHDIGICRVRAPDIGCHGSLPYICHGIAGRDILNEENWPRHALVCERHIGVGLTRRDILDQKLPLPALDMCPISLEEKIIAYADLFFSKSPGRLEEEKSVESVRESVGRWGQDKLEIFDSWHRLLG